jgi:menaquinone-dependent protoporphyrinogen IX oxidase
VKKIITYGSQYGTTKRYAKKLSEITTIPSSDESDVKNLSSFDVIIHLGGLYAGRVKGLKKIVKHTPKQARLIVITVGLADVNNEVNTSKIKNDVKNQIPGDLLKRTQIFHLRGGIDYSKLSITHKAMMTLLYKKVKAMPEEKKTAEIQFMIDTFNQKVDFTDFSTLDSIVQAISHLEEI